MQHGQKERTGDILMTNSLKTIGGCCLAVLVALYIVGAVSHGSLRHEVQTLPLWIPIIAGFNRREFARWCALPCMFFWFAMMSLIWLFLLGWSHLISGHFAPIEIAMTIVVGRGQRRWLRAECLAGSMVVCRLRTDCTVRSSAGPRIPN